MTWPALKRSYSPGEFMVYVDALSPSSLQWAKRIVVHNTWNPTQALHVPGRDTRADVTLQGLENYYRNPPPKGQGWSGGPHLFVDRGAIWTFNPLTDPGVHSPSWNADSWGVETFGDWDLEEVPADLLETLVSALATLHRAANLDPAALLFHFEDPLTTHKHCPGKNLDKADLIRRIQTRLSPIVQP